MEGIIALLKERKKKGKVLLVDAEHALRHKLQQWLVNAGYSVYVVSDGDQAMAWWRVNMPEVVICDIHIDGMDGLSLLRSITSEDKETQVIMLSCQDEMDYVVQALRLGAADYLLKPIDDFEVLEHAVNRGVADYGLMVENRLYRDKLEQKNKALKESLRELKEDQEAGRTVQLKLLPPRHTDYEHLTIDYCIIPSLYLSGDFIDYFQISEYHYGFYLADVSGHGASSAFVTVLLQNMANRIRARLKRASNITFSPASVLSTINDELVPLALGKHVAVFCGVIDMKSHSLTYCSAAHFPPPLLINGNDVIPLEGKGLPLGIFKEAQFTEQRLSLEKKFNLMVLSDGVLEAMPQGTLAEKELFLMEMVEKGYHNTEDVMAALNITQVSEAPDDIALLTVSSKG